MYIQDAMEQHQKYLSDSEKARTEMQEAGLLGVDTTLDVYVPLSPPSKVLNKVHYPFNYTVNQ